MSSAAQLISVVTPTYKRHNMLTRAIDSVRAQTYGNWEMIVSDDEDPPGATWEMLQNIVREEPRVRALRNPGPHGQCGNMNFSLRAARGEWIKPLYDDDAMRPRCLEVLLRAVQGPGRESIVLATCFADRYRHGQLIRSEEIGARPSMQLLPRREARLAMYLQDLDLGIPSQVMVRREVIDRCIFLEPLPGVNTAVDSWWFWRVLGHGDLLMINQTLVEEHQGEHETITSLTTDRMHDQEVDILRQHMYPQMEPATGAPPLRVVRQMLRVIRGLHRAANGRYLEAARLAAGAWDPRAWYLAARWLLRRRYPGRFYVVPRVIVQA